MLTIVGVRVIDIFAFIVSIERTLDSIEDKYLRLGYAKANSVMSSHYQSRTYALDCAMGLLMQNSPVDVQAAVNLVLKIVSNIIEHPMEDKYRKVNTKSGAFTKKIGNLRGGDACMQALGFGLQGDDYILFPTAEAWENLTLCRIVLEKFSKKLESVDISNIAQTASSSVEAVPELSTQRPQLDSDSAALLLQQLVMSMAANSASNGAVTTENDPASSNEMNGNENSEDKS